MTAERWRQIRDVLYAASQLPGSARVEYLNEHCAGDQDLRAEAEKLLFALEQSAGFLEPDTGGSADVRNSRIGPYSILGEAARGGMGIVYHAVREGDYRQEVAVKLIRAGVETDLLTARFQLERQALALLNHPNIARLLDGGTTPQGRPYLVMEWVEGRPITEYCRTQQLNLRERLRLFLDIGDAVEHAHRNLVVHRDLKPSNILITTEGKPKLLDFGIAKIFSAEGIHEPLTMTLGSAPILTPEYASPEQVRGEAVTTATDIYSLGAVLYEALTGVSRLKIETRTREEVERAVCTEEPPAPSDATGPSGLSARELRGDIDNIVLKALNKEPSRRYGSVKEFCDDIRSHLEGRPVLARKDTLAYRAGKFVRRHRAGVVAAALVLITVLAGATATLWEARIAVDQRRRAERRFNDVRKLATSFLFEFHDAIQFLPGSTPARALVVKRALEYLDGLAAEGRGDASLELEIASAYKRVGELQGDPLFPNVGDVQGALASSHKALAILETLVRADPANPRVRRALASVHRQISGVLSFSGDTAGAIEQSGRALQAYETLSGTLAGDPQFQAELVTQQYRHADLLRAAGDLDGASAAYRRAVEVSGRLNQARPSDPEGKIHLATSLDGLGGVLQEKGDTAGALEERRQGLAIREELAASSPDNTHYRRQLAFSHHNVGISLQETGDLTAALGHFERELGLFQSLRAADAKDAQARRNESLAHKQLGDLLLRDGDPQRSLDHYRQSLVIDRELAAADPGNAQSNLDLSFSESGFGSALGKLGNIAQAVPFLRSATVRQELLLKQDPHHILLYGHLANSYTHLANDLLESGDTNTAVELYRKAVAARRKLSEKNPASAANRGALAECYWNLGKALSRGGSSDALAQYNNAIELLEPLAAADKANGRNQARLANALADAARTYARMALLRDEPLAVRAERRNRARSLYQQSYDLWSGLAHSGKLTAEGWVVSRDVTRELAGLIDSVAKLQQPR